MAKNALFLVELFTTASDKGALTQKKRYLASLKRHLRFLASKDIEHKKIPFDKFTHIYD